eukprot:6693341-Karenia_brevis.AAC.1
MQGLGMQQWQAAQPQGSPDICVWNELAYYKGEATLSTLYDMEKFYDKISIPILIREATRLGYPALVPKF